MSEVNIDTENFEPKKASKRTISHDPNEMEVDYKNNVGTNSQNNPAKRKRIRTNTVSETKEDVRKVVVPAHRYSPLKENWLKIFTPIVEHLQLQIRFNLKTRNVEIKTCKDTKNIANLQKAADFVKVKKYSIHFYVLTNNLFFRLLYMVLKLKML